jgi:hypothetical protein
MRVGSTITEMMCITPRATTVPPSVPAQPLLKRVTIATYPSAFVVCRSTLSKGSPVPCRAKSAAESRTDMATPTRIQISPELPNDLCGRQSICPSLMRSTRKHRPARLPAGELAAFALGVPGDAAADVEVVVVAVTACDGGGISAVRLPGAMYEAVLGCRLWGVSTPLGVGTL